MDSDLYTCTRCGAVDCKLWRSYGTFMRDLLCVDCACLKQDVPEWAAQFQENGFRVETDEEELSFGRESCEIQWYVPAVFTEDGPGKGATTDSKTYWGFASGNPDAIKAWDDWKTMPLRMAEEATG